MCREVELQQHELRLSEVRFSSLGETNGRRIKFERDSCRPERMLSLSACLWMPLLPPLAHQPGHHLVVGSTRKFPPLASYALPTPRAARNQGLLPSQLQDRTG